MCIHGVYAVLGFLSPVMGVTVRKNSHESRMGQKISYRLHMAQVRKCDYVPFSLANFIMLYCRIRFFIYPPIPSLVVTICLCKPRCRMPVTTILTEVPSHKMQNRFHFSCSI